MKENRLVLFHLKHCKGVGWKGISSLRYTLPQLSDVFDLSPKELQTILHLSNQNFSKFYRDLHQIDSTSLLSDYEQKNIKWISVEDKNYPSLLKEVYDPPHILFLKGNGRLLDNKKMAIIGSRGANDYTEKALLKFIPSLVNKDITIVSGMAKGADTVAHKLTILFKGNTIGVIGGGFDFIYPKENESLASYMMHNQLLVSEFPPNTRPQKWHFPLRNRIISGLSNAVLVTQAKERSGTLITTDYALEEGRDILVLPGSIFDELSGGTNRLIQQGAKLVLSAEDILSELQV
jgi:DNA processing protein